MAAPGTPDIDDRFREELRSARLPQCIALRGDAMMQAIAARLLARHAPDITIDAHAPTTITLMSMEQYGTAALNEFLEGTDPPPAQTLLTSIPEALLHNYARKQGIPLIEERIDDARKMLDAIAAQQPQTFFSLAKSARRLERARGDKSNTKEQ